MAKLRLCLFHEVNMSPLPMPSLMPKKDDEGIQVSITPSFKRSVSGFSPDEDSGLGWDRDKLPMPSLMPKKDDEGIQVSITPSFKRSVSGFSPDEDSGLGWDRDKLPMPSLMPKKDDEGIQVSITPSFKRSVSGFSPDEDSGLGWDRDKLPMPSLMPKKDDEGIQVSITPSFKRFVSGFSPDEDSGLGWDRDKLPMPSLMPKKDDEGIQVSITPSFKRSVSGFSPDEDSGLGWDRDKDSPFFCSCSRLSAVIMDDVTKSNSSLWSPHELKIKEQGRNIVRKHLCINQESMSGTNRPLKDAGTPVFKKACSSNINIADAKVSVIDAVDRLSDEPGLIADGSRSYCLPTVLGKHRDLTSISCHTMAALVRGNYSEDIGKVTIIDCRYPYEYDGGHIKGAVNIYRRKGIRKLLSLPRDKSAEQNHIMIFHCEFSSERGPKMYRFLRSEDRELHKENYPQLSYPEVYLLDGGYKAFFESYKELCEPDNYTPMLNNDNAEDLRHFRAASKSSAAKMKRHQSRQALRF